MKCSFEAKLFPEKFCKVANESFERAPGTPGSPCAARRARNGRKGWFNPLANVLNQPFHRGVQFFSVRVALISGGVSSMGRLLSFPDAGDQAPNVIVRRTNDLSSCVENICHTFFSIFRELAVRVNNLAPIDRHEPSQIRSQVFLVESG